jgi:hypothetical protein
MWRNEGPLSVHCVDTGVPRTGKFEGSCFGAKRLISHSHDATYKTTYCTVYCERRSTIEKCGTSAGRPTCKVLRSRHLLTSYSHSRVVNYKHIVHVIQCRYIQIVGVCKVNWPIALDADTIKRTANAIPVDTE